MDPRGVLKEDAEFIFFPSSRVTLNNSQKKELPACMYARQVESQAKFLEHKTTQVWKQYLFLGEKRSITYGSGDGKEGTAWNCISFLDWAIEIESRELTLARIFTLGLLVPVFLESPEWTPVSKFFINFSHSWLFKGIMQQFTSISLSFVHSGRGLYRGSSLKEESDCLLS